MPHLPDHQTHDPELIAAYAAGDAAGSALDQATELVAACADCAALHRDLRAIASALPDLPAPARPRDFTLTPDQAASLRPAGWRGLVAAFGSPRFRLAAPLGTGLAAAGLAGLLLASPGVLLPTASSGADTSGGTGAAAGTTVEAAAPEGGAGDAALAAPAGEPSAAATPAATAAAQEFAPEADDQIRALGDGEVPAPSPAASAAAAGLAGDAPSPVEPSTVERDSLEARVPPPSAEPTQDQADTRAVTGATAEPAMPWLVVSIALLVVGVVLVVLRLAARSLARR